MKRFMTAFWKKMFSIVLVLAVALTGVPVSGLFDRTVQAAEEDTADIRFLFTSDLHGQLTTVDYETGGLYSNGSLAKAATLIQEAREEKGINNTMLFDGGDNMYDYTTDYIYNADENAIQPHFQAMASLGYDAITMGNHDFEYTLPYIQKQYDATGLTDKVVLSNVKDANTGASIWDETKMFEKVLTTKQGNQMSVKIGVIGETIPTLSKKRCNYKGVLTTEDIVENATREAAALKAQGANLVVVLAHSGIGEENPEKMATDVGYALTKIPDVDVVLCGHRHAFFCGDGTTSYDKMSGVDTKTGLVNGKNLVMVKNRGAGIGVVDLTLSNTNGSIQIQSRQSSLRKVTAKTEADSNINNNYMGNWANIFIKDRSDILCDLSESTVLQNYFGTMEDSGAIQLINNIRISYGLDYINKEDTTYKDYPVIAASKYLKYGVEDGSDYINITGQFTRANMYDFIDYRTQLYVYRVTGAQVREWLEWTASAYEVPGENVLNPSEQEPEASAEAAEEPTPDTATGASMDSTARDILFKASASVQKGVADDYQDVLHVVLDNYTGTQPIQSALGTDWISNWSNFNIFDGIEYTIDTKPAPRYSQTGEKINETQRITSLTRNGAAVADTDQFILVSYKLSSSNVPVLQEIAQQELYHGSTDLCRSYIESYLDKVSRVGTLKNEQDDNWQVTYGEDIQYLVKTGDGAQAYASSKDWLVNLLDSENGFSYYQADFSKMQNTDTTGPLINALSLKDEETNRNVPVIVQATDRAGVKSVKYMKGKYLKDSNVWSMAYIMTGNTFECDENGIYSILAEDNLGNKSIEYIRIDNINKSALEAPKVNNYTNRMKKISGTAEPDAYIYFELKNGTIYSDSVAEDGTFSYELPPQKSGSKVYVYVTDDEGRASARTVVTVKRTGPNKPTLDVVETRSRTISGTLNDSYVYPVVFVNEKTAYVDKNGTKDLYKASSIYQKSYKIVEVNMNITDDGKFSFEMNELEKKGAIIDLRTLDAIGRNSLRTRKKVKQTVPAKPSMDSVTNKTKAVKVYSEEKCSKASVVTGKKTYTTTKSKYLTKKKLYQYTVKIPKTDSGVSVKAYVTNVKGNSPKITSRKQEVVPDTPKLNKLSPKKKITGSVHLVGSDNEKQTVSNTKTKVFVYVDKKRYKARIKKSGIFKVKLKKKLAAGNKVVCQAQNLNGKSLKRVKKVK